MTGAARRVLAFKARRACFFEGSMKTSDFSYDLPPKLVATHPTAQRDACRLMALLADSDAPQHLAFSDLPSLLRLGDLLVLNDTRVIPARLEGKRLPGGGEAELLLLEPASEDGWTWRCLGRPGAQADAGASPGVPRGPSGGDH
jgi:S-adenosylmethionine:tRNA ribosyltransferase-isomerase